MGWLDGEGGGLRERMEGEEENVKKEGKGGGEVRQGERRRG